MTPELKRRLLAAVGAAGQDLGDLPILISLDQTVYNKTLDQEETISVATQPVGVYEGRLIVGEDAIGSVAYANGELARVAGLVAGRLTIANPDGRLNKYLDHRVYAWGGWPGVVKIGAVDLDPSLWGEITTGTLILAQEPTVDAGGNIGLVYAQPSERLNRLAQPNTFEGFGYAYRFHRDEADENWINHGDAFDFGSLSFTIQARMRYGPRQPGQTARVFFMKRGALNTGAGYAWIGQAGSDGMRWQMEDDLADERQVTFAASWADNLFHTFTIVVDRDLSLLQAFVDDQHQTNVSLAGFIGKVSAPAGIDAVLGWRSDHATTSTNDRCDFDVAEFRVWHRALTAEEIRSHWNKTVDPGSTNLEALYRYNVNEGDKSYNDRGGPRSRWLTLSGGWVEAEKSAAGRPRPSDGAVSGAIQLGGKTAPASDVHVFGKMDYIGNTPQDGWAIFYNSTTDAVEVIVANGGTTAKVSLVNHSEQGRLMGVAFRYDPAGDGFLIAWAQRGRDIPLDIAGTAAATFAVPEATAPLALLQPGSVAEPDSSSAGGGGQVSWQIYNAATHHEANELNAENWSYVEVPHNRDPTLELGLPAVTPPLGGADYEIVFAYHAPLGGGGLQVTIDFRSGAVPAVVQSWVRDGVPAELVVETHKIPQASVPDPNNLSFLFTWTRGTPPAGDEPGQSIYPLSVYVPDAMTFNGTLDFDPWYRKETDDDTLEIFDMVANGPIVNRKTWLSPHWSSTGVSAANIFEVSIPLGPEPDSHDFTRLVIWAARRLHDGLAAEVSNLTLRLQSGTLDVTRDLYLKEDADYGFRLSAAESALMDWEGVALVRISEIGSAGATVDSHPIVHEIWIEADQGDPDVGAGGYEARNVSAAVIGGAEYYADVSAASFAPAVLSLNELTGMLNYYVVPPDDYPDLPVDPKDPVYAWLELADSVLSVDPLLWRLDDGSGNVVRDAGPGSYDGTLFGLHEWGGLDGAIAPHQAKISSSAKYDDLKNSDSELDRDVVTQGEWVLTYTGEPRLVGVQKPVVAGSAMGVPLVHVGGGAWMVSDPALGTILDIRRIYANGLPVPSWQWTLIGDQNVALLGPGFDGYEVTADVYGITDTTGVDGPLVFLWRTDQIAKRLLGAKGAGITLDTSSLDAFVAEYPYRVGVAYGLDRRWTLEDLMRELAGPRGWWSQTPGGAWRLSAISDVSAATPVLTLNESSILSVEILPTKDPTSEIRLGANRQWHVVDTFLGGVSEPDRDRQSQEWRRSVAPTPAQRDAILAEHPRAREWAPTSSISGEADGALEVAELVDLYALTRRFLRVGVALDFLEADHGDVVSIEWPRLGLTPARNYVVVGSTFGMQGSRPVWTLVVFGPFIAGEDPLAV